MITSQMHSLLSILVLRASAKASVFPSLINKSKSLVIVLALSNRKTFCDYEADSLGKPFSDVIIIKLYPKNN